MTSGGAFRLREGLTLHLARLSDADFLDLKEPDSDLAADAVGLARRFVEFHIEVGLSGLAYSNVKGA